jgi:hypothetical protein
MTKKDEPVAFSIQVQPGDAEDIVSSFKKSVRSIRELLPYHKEMQLLMAKALRMKYEALIGEGFAPEQALFLCKDGPFK